MPVFLDFCSRSGAVSMMLNVVSLNQCKNSMGLSSMATRAGVFSRFAVKTPASARALYQHFRSAWPPGPFLAPISFKSLV